MITPLTGWQVGYASSRDCAPETMIPATVPGAVQLDYARAHDWPPFTEGVNFRDYHWMEDVYWLYTAPLRFDAAPGERAFLVFSGIDYRYTISVDGELLCGGEGMFSTVRCDVTRFAGRDATLRVWLDPVPKADDSDTRTQGRKSCKSVACYGWDWHPRLVSTGLWDEVRLVIEDARCILDLDASYALTPALDACRIDASIAVGEDCAVRLTLLDGETAVAQGIQETQGKRAQLTLSLENPVLWYPAGYGEQHLYCLKAETLDAQGNVLSTHSRNLGLRRSRMVMNEGSWAQPADFPQSRSDAPATLEINGRRIFAKGSNWVNAQVFPGEMSAAHYDRLLTLVKDANMNILRIWGGGFINKESFFDLCDEKGIMVWQEFPLACNEYPDDDAYLSVLRREATAIVRRLRTHPCLVLWCGGNELFNSWSGMTDQHHALRLLNSVCYAEDRFTPFIMTSPLNGMAHGHYVNYDEDSHREFITDLVASRNTAYTEFGSPGAVDPAYIKQYISPEDYADCSLDNAVWVEHHAFKAWGEGRWLRKCEADYYFGGCEDVDDLCIKTQFIQAMCYKSLFEEMRKQWPHCAMALKWCLNEPWPTFANNSLISWPDQPRPAYYAVQQALRAQLSSLRVDRHLWWAGERFHAEVWMLNDSSVNALDASEITVSYALGDGADIEWGTLRCPALAAQDNRECGAISFPIPADFSGKITINLRVKDRPALDSTYTYLCRRREAVSTQGMLNV